MSSASLASTDAAPALRRMMTPAQVRARSVRVRGLRTGFTAAAAVSLAVLAAAVTLKAIQPAGLGTGDVVQGDRMVIDTPRFVGRTAQGERFVVTARRAVRRLGDAGAPVTLEQPRLEVTGNATVTADTGTWAQTRQPGSTDALSGQRLVLGGNIVVERADGDRGTAQQAVWTPSPNVLALSGGVSLVRRNGDRATSQVAVWRAQEASLNLEGGAVVNFADGEARSRSARIENGGRTLTGEGEAQIRASLGIATADRYVYDTETRRLRLQGRARATISGNPPR
jgi:hypothetical protein